MVRDGVCDCIAEGQKVEEMEKLMQLSLWSLKKDFLISTSRVFLSENEKWL